MAVAAYYFDGSDAAATDPNAVWTNDANAFDGSISTFASTSAIGSTSTNYLMAEGTNAPASSDVINWVWARVYAAGGEGTGVYAAIYTDGLAQLLGTAQALGFLSGGFWGSSHRT